MKIRILARVIVYSNNKILLVRNKDADFWYIPGGGWEYEKENLIEGGIREVKEETGLDVGIDKFLYLREYHESEESVMLETYWLSSLKNEVDLNKDHIDADSNGKVEEAKWFTKEELKNTKFFPVFLKDKFWDDFEKIDNNADRFIAS
jgi:8-oxo-dGTP diphosphatase